jgi:inner membrane protein
VPTIVTHAAVAMALGRTVTGRRRFPRRWWTLTALLSMLPDADVIGWGLVPYNSLLGHRGLTHSLAAAVVMGLAATPLLVGGSGLRWWVVWAYAAATVASHGALDALTRGGEGVAFFAPFDDTRYFFPWRPVRVSPIGIDFFGRAGLGVLASELLWLWLPAGLVLAASSLLRWRTSRSRPLTLP